MSTRTPAGMFSAPEAARLTGLSHRQLDYWTRCGAVVPDVRSSGSGMDSVWSRASVARLWAIGAVVADLRAVLQVPVTTALVAELWRQLCERGEASIGTSRVRIAVTCESIDAGEELAAEALQS